MTIEIKQLVIRAVVEEKRERTPAAPARSRAAEPPRRATRTKSEHDALVAECVRHVMRQLHKARGR